MIYDIAFPFKENPMEVIIVSTTRPETLFGDIAIAVHPQDPRYHSHIGKYLQHPITGRSIPIIADSTLVDISLGSGAVKITPAHDLNDFEAYQRLSTSLKHQLPILTVISDKGTLTNIVDQLCTSSSQSYYSQILQTLEITKWEGMNRFDARHFVLKFLEEKSKLLHSSSSTFYYRGKRDHKMRLNICSRR